jgi:hypothetical protein
MTITSTTPDSGTGIDQPPQEAANVRYIPNRTLRRLNKIAHKHGMNSLTDDCPVLQDCYTAPIFFAHSGCDTTGWVRCMIPATPDCEIQVCLDIQCEDFYDLPVYTSQSETPEANREPQATSISLRIG